jgi:hypothetical protein
LDPQKIPKQIMVALEARFLFIMFAQDVNPSLKLFGRDHWLPQAAHLTIRGVINI